MNREQRLQSWPLAIARPSRDRAALPVLIQVPRIALEARSAGRRSVGKPRRRLRREVRWGLYALLAVVPPTLSALAYREGRQAALLEVRGPSPEDAAPEFALPPRVSLSIEPASALPSAEPQAPVMFPGYLLPDDSLEEPAHAGD